MDNDTSNSQKTSINSQTDELKDSYFTSNQTESDSTQTTQTVQDTQNKNTIHWYETNTNTFALSISTYLSLLISFFGFFITIVSIQTVKKHIMLVKYNKKIHYITTELENILSPYKKKYTGLQINPDVKKSIIGQLKEMKKFTSRKDQNRLDSEIEDIKSMEYISQLKTCVYNIITDFSYTEVK